MSINIAFFFDELIFIIVAGTFIAVGSVELLREDLFEKKISWSKLLLSQPYWSKYVSWGFGIYLFVNIYFLKAPHRIVFGNEIAIDELRIPLASCSYLYFGAWIFLLSIKKEIDQKSRNNRDREGSSLN